MKKQLKLYVWENVLTDHTDGIMFAMAHSVEEAREIILKRQKDQLIWITEEVEKDLIQEPKVFDSPTAFIIGGGA